MPEKIDKIKLNDNFTLNLPDDILDNCLINQGQLVYFIESLISLAQFYKSKKDIHGDFNPKNISKK